MAHPNPPVAANPAAIAQQSQHSGSPPGARGLRLGNAPTVSIVLASVRGGPALEACIEALLPSCAASGIELVVVRSTTAEEFRDLQNRYRAALFMPAPDGSSVRILRGYGLAAAEGDIVTFLDDAQPPGDAWLRHVAALTQPASAP